jgi:hypothetical protein
LRYRRQDDARSDRRGAAPGERMGSEEIRPTADDSAHRVRDAQQKWEKSAPIPVLAAAHAAFSLSGGRFDSFSLRLAPAPTANGAVAAQEAKKGLLGRMSRTGQKSRPRLPEAAQRGHAIEGVSVQTQLPVRARRARAAEAGQEGGEGEAPTAGAGCIGVSHNITISPQPVSRAASSCA